jgi:hypothetical protein
LRDLFQFFGGYFHQDWALDYKSDEDAVKDFRTEASPDQIAAVIREIDELLSMGYSEEELRRIAHRELACDYNPSPDGLTMSDWIRRVRNLITA